MLWNGIIPNIKIKMIVDQIASWWNCSLEKQQIDAILFAQNSVGEILFNQKLLDKMV